MNNSILSFALFVFLISCSQPKPRSPITHSSGYDQSASISFNKNLYADESNLIKSFIQKDSLHEYTNSQFGFWYAYVVENKDDEVFPVKGNTITYSYNIYDFDGNEIYSADEIGVKQYRVDQEDNMKGIQEGIKLMNVGEKIIFLLPSHQAYAYHGDENKIGTNTPIIVALELIDIK